MNTERKKCIIYCIACLVAVLLGGCFSLPVQTEPTTVPVTTQEPTTEPTTVPTTEAPPLALEMELPAQPQQITMEETLVFQGTADPRYPVQINGQTVQPDENGRFFYEAELAVGENTFTLTYLDETLEYAATRRYTTLWYAHEEGASCYSGASVYAELYAREGSSVRVMFRGEVHTLMPSDNQLGMGAPEGFDYYVYGFTAPGKNEDPINLGAITYTVTCDDITEVYKSGDITCEAAVPMKKSNPDVTPDTAPYQDVGSGYIVEIVDVNAETFNGENLDNKSIPTMNYLPKGTVDYGTQGTYYNSSARRYYYKLRCGVRVYSRNDNKPLGMAPVVDCYNGYLPDHNEINVAAMEVSGHHSYLTLDCLWKAPFFFDEEPQEYKRDNWYRYILEDYNPTYVDITFCYATVFTGNIEIPEDHPLFSGAEVIQNEADHTLRLYLKAPGAFYGWSAYYNQQDQLVFEFLNPVTVTQADNAYGADLTGITVMLDVGHGGEDPGAFYSDSRGKNWKESERNLYLSNLVKEELESIGATVLMNRTDEERTTTRTERIAYLMEQAPDICLCVHHNADIATSLTGYESWYFTSHSRNAAEHVLNTNLESEVYRRGKMSWNTYFLARQTVCPVVLAENGYMSNSWEMNRIADNEIMARKAKALVQGIVNYYLELSGYEVTYNIEE